MQKLLRNKIAPEKMKKKKKKRGKGFKVEWGCSGRGVKEAKEMHATKGKKFTTIEI